MKSRIFRPTLGAALVGMLLASLLPAVAQQTYRNIVNTRFRTVSNGPQSAIIVDVKDPNDATAVQKAVLDTVRPRLEARDSALRRELAFLRQRGVLKPGQQFDMNDAVILRHNGKLLLPDRDRTRSHGGGNELEFEFPTSGEGAWSVQAAAELVSFKNLIYPQLREVYGHPGWTGPPIKVRNLDPRLGKADEVIGALLVINGGNVEIYFPTFTAYETKFLALTQVMAQAFHGPKRIAYDAWEMGMARAAAVVVATRLQPQIGTAGQTVNPSNGFYFTAFYDVLNQPALGNNTFTPPTASNKPFSVTTLSGMLVPRLQMSSTAWLKCYIENPNFFKLFNTGSANGGGSGGYYGALVQEPNTANDVTRLRALAAAAVPTVEGVPFQNWYEQQFVLDTSVTPGPKLFAYTQPTFPTGQQGNDSGAAVFLIYYRTTPTGDEIDLNGTVNVIYWDYTFATRLFFPSFDTVTITNGFGDVAPFFSGIGGGAGLEDKMRIAMDFPINKEYARVYFPAGQTGTEANPNDFSGVLVGANEGTLAVQYEGGSGTVTASVDQGAFGGKGTGNAVPNSFSRTRITYTSDPPGTTIEFRRNTAFNNDLGVAPMFVLPVPGNVDTFTHTFPIGVQLISLPFRPVGGNLANLITGLGLTGNNALLAQYRQDAPGADKYLRFPSLPLYQPGYGLWISLDQAHRTINNLRGERTDNQSEISIAVPFGWTQIGSPYPSNVNITTDLTVQYLGQDVLTFAEAIQRGWIMTGINGYIPGVGYQDIMTTQNVNIPRNILEAWKGYWIRVMVTEGVTLTFTNPATRAARLKSGRTRVASDPAKEAGGWRVPLSVTDEEGTVSTAVFGQSPRGSDTFTPSLHVAAPPAFTRAASLGVRFPHADWDAGQGGQGGEFLTDIRRTDSRSTWEVVVSVPQPEKNYTLGWSMAEGLPRGMRLTLVDKQSGSRRVLNNGSSYSFRAGKGELTRRFEITAEPRAGGHLRISNVAAVPSGNRAVSTVAISYELTDVADTTVEIRLAGRIVRRLATGRAAQVGLNQVIWDTRDDAGRTLPAGAYTIQINARTPEGAQTRSVVPLLLSR